MLIVKEFHILNQDQRVQINLKKKRATLIRLVKQMDRRNQTFTSGFPGDRVKLPSDGVKLDKKKELSINQ